MQIGRAEQRSMCSKREVLTLINVFIMYSVKSENYNFTKNVMHILGYTNSKRES